MPKFPCEYSHLFKEFLNPPTLLIVKKNSTRFKKIKKLKCFIGIKKDSIIL
jgi:hypothetical protein